MHLHQRITFQRVKKAKELSVEEDLAEMKLWEVDNILGDPKNVDSTEMILWKVENILSDP